MTFKNDFVGMITIRSARQDDKESIWRVHIRAIKEICKSHYSEQEIQAWVQVLKPGRYEEAIRKGPFYLAADGTSILGFGNLNQENGEIEALYVDPDHVGRGVGIKILRALEKEAVDSGLKLLRITSSLNAVSFYEMAGYKQQRQKRWLLPSEMVGCAIMTKELI